MKQEGNARVGTDKGDWDRQSLYDTIASVISQIVNFKYKNLKMLFPILK